MKMAASTVRHSSVNFQINSWPKSSRICGLKMPGVEQPQSTCRADKFTEGWYAAAGENDKRLRAK